MRLSSQSSLPHSSVCNFCVQNVVATYIGVALYAVLYAGYSAYAHFSLGKSRHFVPASEVDFVSDAVWQSGEGLAARDKEKEALAALKATSSQPLAKLRVWVKEYVW